MAERELLEHVAGRAPGAAMDLAVEVVGAVRELVGDHVEHNAYFIDFPRDVPDTVSFWVAQLRRALTAAPADGEAGGPTDDELRAVLGPVLFDLLALPAYGRYQHTYAELLAAHDELIASAKDRVTVLQLGGTVEEETHLLYRDLAGSVTPLGTADLELLAELAERCGDVELDEVPVRENRAVVNAARLAAGRPLVGVDTVLDVLRTACEASGGDVTLAEPTRFRSFRRRERRALLTALDRVVAGDEGKLGDVARFARAFKRLGEGLHPHEFSQLASAREVFAVARGERAVRSTAGRAELAFAAGDVAGAARILASAPGMLMRSLDRLLRTAGAAEQDAVLDAVQRAVGSVSGRVLCSVREHLANRARPDAARVFTTGSGRAWVTGDTRPPLVPEVITRVGALIDRELSTRLPAWERLVVDPAVLDVALPLSGRASEAGFAVFPRGSRTRLDGEVLRLFTYCEAPSGATEFIDVPLDSVGAAYVVPQVNIYAGEGFDEVAESMFGWMTRDRAQAGAPFEARTVRMRSDMRGSGRVALPVLEREYLTVGHLVELARGNGTVVTTWDPDAPPDGPVTFLGPHRPERLPAGKTVITLEGLSGLIPR